jgi:RNA polymerase sigma factor (TIGR02999 family)
MDDFASDGHPRFRDGFPQASRFRFGHFPQSEIESPRLRHYSDAGADITEVTQLLNAIDQGAPHAAAELLPLVYDELRRLAAARLADEPSGNTLQPTALVHEAYLRLVGSPDGDDWSHRGHFYAAAAEAMRRILVEQARRKKRHKHGGQRRRLSLEAAESLAVAPSEDLTALDEALTRLAAHDPIKAEVVKLRFFVGLTMSEVARALQLSQATAERYWAYARLWLYAELTDHGHEETT